MTDTSVQMRTERGDLGVTYSVLVQSDEGDGYDGDDGMREVWELEVRFRGSGTGARWFAAGGPAFIETARLQKTIAGEVWEARAKPWRELRADFEARRPNWWSEAYQAQGAKP